MIKLLVEILLYKIKNQILLLRIKIIDKLTAMLERRRA